MTTCPSHYPPLLEMYPFAPAHMAVYPTVDRITPMMSVVFGPYVGKKGVYIGEV